MPASVTRPPAPSDAAVLVHVASDPLVDPEQEWQWLAGLEESLALAVGSASAGELEGVYLVGEQWVIRAHGASLDPLWAAVSEVLARWPLPVNSYALYRDGAVPAHERRVAIGADPDIATAPVGRPTSTWRPLSEQGVLAALAMSSAS